MMKRGKGIGCSFASVKEGKSVTELSVGDLADVAPGSDQVVPAAVINP